MFLFEQFFVGSLESAQKFAVAAHEFRVKD